MRSHPPQKLLAPLSRGFTEGLSTADLVAAKRWIVPAVVLSGLKG